MDKVKLGLLTTLLLGIFILIGAILAFLVKKKEKVVENKKSENTLLLEEIRDLLKEKNK